MPSTSPAQANMMAAAAHNPAFAKHVGVPQSVAQDFNQADKGKHIIGRSRSTPLERAKKRAAVLKAR
jgi:hypothetical protein